MGDKEIISLICFGVTCTMAVFVGCGIGKLIRDAREEYNQNKYSGGKKMNSIVPYRPTTTINDFMRRQPIYDYGYIPIERPETALARQTPKLALKILEAQERAVTLREGNRSLAELAASTFESDPKAEEVEIESAVVTRNFLGIPTRATHYKGIARKRTSSKKSSFWYTEL